MTATTGVDSLLELLKDEKDIEMSDAADKLGVSKEDLQQWVDFLVENNRVMVHYKFMNPYLTLLDPRGRSADNDTRQTLSSIRQHQKKFSTAIKTKDVETAKEELKQIKQAIQSLDDPSLQRDLRQEIMSYPDRVKKIGGAAGNVQANDEPSEDLTQESFKALFKRVKKRSQSGDFQRAKKVVMALQEKLDAEDIPAKAEQQIKEKIEKAKHNIETAQHIKAKKGGEVQ